VKLYPGWTFETVDNMSFEQINSAIREGKKPAGIPIESHEEAHEINRNWRQYVGI
jgi:hypothetical protein